MGVGSKLLCKEFIRKENLLEYFPDAPEEWVNKVVDYYNRILYSISPEVINASSDPNRSDILVFIVVMSILLGDSGYIISEWVNNIDIDRTPLESFKNLIVLSGYNWNYSLADGEFIDDGIQRHNFSGFFDVIKNKGTEGSVISSIINYAYEDFIKSEENYLRDPHVSDVEVEENLDANWKLGVSINSKYVTRYVESGPDPEDPELIEVPVYKNAHNAYSKTIRNRLEEVRPAGVYFFYPEYLINDGYNLRGFDGLSYYRHLYNDLYYAWTYIRYLTSFINRVKVLSGTEMVPPYESYKLLYVSMNYEVSSISLHDYLNIPFSDVKDLSFVSGTYDNSANDIEYSGNSMLYDTTTSPISLQVVSDWDFRLLMRPVTFGIDRLEIIID